ncbi:MAG: hypothetical protein KDB14_30245 [Planctomycetales bacterium]|nr:hypothetical protein [Planctomycetales bacterium]
MRYRLLSPDSQLRCRQSVATIVMAAMALGLCLPAICVAEPLKLSRLAASRPFDNSSFALAATADGGQYAIAGRKGTIVVYDGATHVERHRLEHDRGMVLALAYSQPARCLVAAGDPRLLRVISLDAPRVLREIELPYRCGFVATHPTLPIAALSGRTPTELNEPRHQQVLFVNLRTGAAMGGLTVPFQRGFQLEFSPDGRALYAIFAEQHGALARHVVHEVSTAKLTEQAFVAAQPPTRPLYHAEAALRNMALAPSGKHLAVMDQAGQVTLLALPAGAAVYQWPGAAGSGNVLTFLDSQHLLATGKQQWRFYHVDRFESLLVQADDDSASANHLLRLPGALIAVSSHARAANQLTRWELQGLSEAAPPRPSGGLAPLLTRNTTPAPTMVKPGLPGEQPDATTAKPPVGPSPAAPHQPIASTVPAQPETPAFANRFRPWTQAATQRSVQATAVGRDGDQLLLVAEDGQEFIVSIQTLTEEDQAYCKSLFRDTTLESSTTSLRTPLSALLATPATQALAPKLPIASDDVDWLVQTLACDRPQQPLRVRSSKPNGRGGSWLATELGLAEYDVASGEVVMRALAPDVSDVLGEPLPASISLLEVDRFARPIVLWGNSGHAFRWNGRRWTHLTPPRGTLVRWLTRSGPTIFAVLANQNAAGPSLAKLDGAAWSPLAVTVNGNPLQNVERLFGSHGGHLVGVRRDGDPVRINGLDAQTFEAKRLDAFHLKFNESLMGALPKVAVANDGRVYFVRLGTGVDTELVEVAEQTRALPTTIEGMERPNVLGIVVDQETTWLHVAPSQAELARKIIEAGRKLRSNIGVFVRQGERWQRVDTHVDALPTVQVDRTTARSAVMSWTANPAMALFVAPRVWKTADGSHEILASCADLDESSVTLRRPSGESRVPRSVLDSVDQRFLRRLERHRDAIDAAPPTLRRVFRKRTAGDTFINEDWQGMLNAGTIFPKISQVAGPLRHEAPQEHLWVIDGTNNVSHWESDRLKPAPTLTAENVIGPQSPKQLVVDNEGQVFIRCVDGRVRTLSGDRWTPLPMLEQNLVVHHLRIVHDRLLAVVGPPNASQRAAGAAPSPLSGVVQWSEQRWKPVILLNAAETGGARDVALAPAANGNEEATGDVSPPGQSSMRVVVSWGQKRLTLCDLDRPSSLTMRQFQALPETPDVLWPLVVSNGMLFSVAPTGSLCCLWDERADQFDLRSALWNPQGGGQPAATSLQADRSGLIWQGLISCHRGGRVHSLAIEGELPRGAQLIGDRYLAVWGSHLSLYEITR